MESKGIIKNIKEKQNNKASESLRSRTLER